MSNELVSGLIQMNSKMIYPDWAVAIIAIGAAVIAIILVTLLIQFIDAIFEKRRIAFRNISVFFGILFLSLALLIYGVTVPRIKEIKACAYGPVSMEQIAVKYDITNINGKEITLRERK